MLSMIRNVEMEVSLVTCVCRLEMCILYCIPTVVNSGGDDVVYGDLKNDLYSSVSHITFTHLPRFVSISLIAVLGDNTNG